MGKPTGKKKGHVGSKTNGGGGGQVKHGKAAEHTSKAFDEDTSVFINMSQELKDEGNRLFQKRDHEGAMLKYEKALKLLPRNHIDVAYLRSNMAACYMQLGMGEYPRALNECNLALEVAPKYSKALLKRARCYEGLTRLDLALRDVNHVLSMEPNNLTALEIAESVKKAIDKKGIQDKAIVLPPEYVEPPFASSPSKKVVKKKKTASKLQKKKVNKIEKKKEEEPEDKKAEDKVVVEEKRSVKEEKVVTKTVKLVLDDDIRWAQLPLNCSIRQVRDIVLDRFPNLQGVLIKYRDQEGDLITITTTEELRLAEASGDPQGISRLYVAEISPDKEPSYEIMNPEEGMKRPTKPDSMAENGNVENSSEIETVKTCVEDWIIQFAKIFKNHVGFDCDSYLDLHQLGMKLYSEAMEDTVTSEDAQGLFEIAAVKFQEMAALAMFNWGNVHIARARKRVYFTEDGSLESMFAQIKSAYEWAQSEYAKAGKKYEEALRIKPDFYEGLLALGKQQFEQAKLAWYYALATKVDLETGESYQQVMEIYNKAEDSMERGVQMWEEMEEQRLNGLSKSEKYRSDLENLGLEGLIKEISPDEAADQVANLRSQIYLMWGTLLYERSVVEYKLSLPTWEECLEVAIEKFELAGASQTDIAVMIKNHCSNDTALEGDITISLYSWNVCFCVCTCNYLQLKNSLVATSGFKVDELVQAWNEMYDANRWHSAALSFRLGPLFHRQVSNLQSVLEHI